MDALNQKTLVQLSHEVLTEGGAGCFDLVGPDAGAVLALVGRTLSAGYHTMGFAEALAVVRPKLRVGEMKRWVTLVLAAANLFGRIAREVGMGVSEWPAHLEIRPARLFSVYGYRDDRGFEHGPRQTIEALCILASLHPDPLSVTITHFSEDVQVARLLLPQSALELLRDRARDGTTAYHAFARYGASRLTTSTLACEVVPTVVYQPERNGPAQAWDDTETFESVREAHRQLLNELMLRHVPDALNSPDMMAANARLAMAACRLAHHVILHIPAVINGAGIDRLWIRDQGKITGVSAELVDSVVSEAVLLGSDNGKAAMAALMKEQCGPLLGFYAPKPKEVSPEKLLDAKIDWKEFMSMDARVEVETASPTAPLRATKRIRLMDAHALKATVPAGIPGLYRPNTAARLVGSV